MTLRLTDDERSALQQQAQIEGISMQEVARRAIRQYVAGAHTRDRLTRVAEGVLAAHAEALDRLGR